MAIQYSDKIRQILIPNVSKSTSRYLTKIRLANINNTTKIRFIRKRDVAFNNEDATVHTVTAIENCRPDFIAVKYYGDTKYTWVILAANNLKTMFDLKAGMKILIPSFVELQGLYGKLVTR